MTMGDGSVIDVDSLSAHLDTLQTIDSSFHFNPIPSQSEYVASLDSLGFFSLLDHPYDDSVRAAMGHDFDPDAGVGYRWREGLDNVSDHRIFGCDGEALFEDGFAEMLDELKPSFERRGLKLTTNRVQSSNETRHNVTVVVTVNDRRYQIFDKYNDALHAWADAAYRLACLLNAELALQHSNERVYLSSGGNDGMLYILTPEQHDYLDRVHRTIAEKPLDVDRWGALNDVTPTPKDLGDR